MNIQFILNDREIIAHQRPATTLLDFIRYHQNLRGTKIGCREGDCGACTVLIGTLNNNSISYRSVISCLTPLANVRGKHVVTIEGLSTYKLNKVQEAMVFCSGTQCGFCTPGFVVSLCGYVLNPTSPSFRNAADATDGNICRCTGYKSIEKAAVLIDSDLKELGTTLSMSNLVAHGYVPSWFINMHNRLAALHPTPITTAAGRPMISGGTDLYVQQHDELHDADLNFMAHQPEEPPIAVADNICHITGSCTATDLIESAILRQSIPRWYDYLKLVSSTPIRNIATLSGNLANASPIGDFTIMLLALDAKITLQNKEFQERELPLSAFYTGYKTMHKAKDEIIFRISFKLPDNTQSFHFEKVCKRTYLDIASVNTAICLTHNNTHITQASIAMGGVSPVPLLLAKTNSYLTNKPLTPETVKAAAQIMQDEISPISDARGSESYKRLLARQLFFAHFITLCPQAIKLSNLI